MKTLLMGSLTLFLLCFTELRGDNQAAFDGMSIRITSPVNKARLMSCTDIIFTAEADANGKEIKAVKFYRNDRLLGKDKDSKPPFEFVWKNAYDGFSKITAELTDYDNTLLLSDPVFLYVGDALDGDLISNGEFNCKLTPWILQNYEGAQSTYLIDPTYNLSDSNGLLVEITNPGTETWHIQLYQPLPIVEGHTYEISFMADVMVDKPITIGIQQGPSPYTSYLWRAVTLSDSLIYGPYTFQSTVTDPTCKFLFALGGSDVSVGLDAVHVFDRSFSGVTFRDLALQEPTQYLFSQNYPNPFNSSTTIQYDISETARVQLAIYSITGQKVLTLVDEEQSAGIHRVLWNGSDEGSRSLPSGIYIYQVRAEMSSRTLIHSQKIILAK